MRLEILDPADRAALIRRRRRLGHDRFDEVWNGVYVMSPMANNEHQEVVSGLTISLGIAIVRRGLGKVLPGANVSDRTTKWEKNYRCPDVLVSLNGSTAQDKKTHWLGGPDFAVEVVSRHDKSREKLDFYAKVGTRELLIVDRDPWSLELYRLNAAGGFDLADRSTLERPDSLTSMILPVSFQLIRGPERPMILVADPDGNQIGSA